MKLLKLLLIVPILFCSGCEKDTRTNAEQYVDLLQESRSEADFHTELYIFPETIENLEIKAFYYAHMEDLFTGSFLLYIVLEYDENTYAPEIERIANVEAKFKEGKTKSIISYPEQNLFLTIKQNGRYEYVIYNDSTYEIAYISNQLFDWGDTPVAEQYVIPNLSIPAGLDDGENMYNLYYWYEGGVGFYVNE